MKKFIFTMVLCVAVVFSIGAQSSSQQKPEDIEKNLGVSYTKANKLRSLAEELEIVSQISAGTRNRKYSYHTYISILSEGTEMVLDREVGHSQGTLRG